MYSASQYRTDLKKAAKPFGKSLQSFGKSFRKLDPFTAFWPCFAMVARGFWLLLQVAFFTARRLSNT